MGSIVRELFRRAVAIVLPMFLGVAFSSSATAEVDRYGLELYSEDAVWHAEAGGFDSVANAMHEAAEFVLSNGTQAFFYEYVFDMYAEDVDTIGLACISFSSDQESMQAQECWSLIQAHVLNLAYAQVIGASGFDAQANSYNYAGYLRIARALADYRVHGQQIVNYIQAYTPHIAADHEECLAADGDYRNQWAPEFRRAVQTLVWSNCTLKAEARLRS